MNDAAPEPAAAAAPEFLTSDEAAAILRWTASTVRQKASAAEIPGIRLGRHWRFERERLLAYIRGEWQPANGARRVDPFPAGEGLAARIFREEAERIDKERSVESDI